MRAKDRFEVLLEDMNAKFDAIMEYVRDIPEMKVTLNQHSRDIAKLKVHKHA
jgi:uncharacterized protein YoxC